ncbi:hypothetical protein [Achromobacter ruhlandii]|uniref:hypothetical protein n=1 Tax=Achromobacter ruhlandii TaxID=72557 RepID=UPI003B9E8407
MEFLGVKWSWGTPEEFWVTLACTLTVIFITFGGHQLLAVLGGKSWRHRPNGVIFTLLLAVSIVLGGWLKKWIFD